MDMNHQRFRFVVDIVDILQREQQKNLRHGQVIASEVVPPDVMRTWASAQNLLIANSLKPLTLLDAPHLAKLAQTEGIVFFSDMQVFHRLLGCGS
jgi:hypothetical protein